MRIATLILLLPLALAGCLSFSSSSPPRQTIVVPQTTTALPPGSRVICADGTQPPC
jgi:hypothetical protein